MGYLTNDKIIIKGNFINRNFWIVLFFIYLIFPISFNDYFEDLFIIGCFVDCFMYLLFISIIFSYGRQIVFTKNGCEVSFLFFSKKYKWEEITNIKYEYYSQYKWDHAQKSNDKIYKSCIIFSKRKIKKKDFEQPYVDLTLKWFRPFSTFNVNFLHNYNYKPNFLDDMVYIGDEYIFRKKLEEWGIIVEGINDPPKIWDEHQKKVISSYKDIKYYK